MHRILKSELVFNYINNLNDTNRYTLDKHFKSIDLFYNIKHKEKIIIKRSIKYI